MHIHVDMNSFSELTKVTRSCHQNPRLRLPSCTLLGLLLLPLTCASIYALGQVPSGSPRQCAAWPEPAGREPEARELLKGPESHLPLLAAAYGSPKHEWLVKTKHFCV